MKAGLYQGIYLSEKSSRCQCIGWRGESAIWENIERLKGQDAKGYIAVKKVFKMQLTASMIVVGQLEYWEKQMNSLSKARKGYWKGYCTLRH